MRLMNYVTETTRCSDVFAFCSARNGVRRCDDDIFPNKTKIVFLSLSSAGWCHRKMKTSTNSYFPKTISTVNATRQIKWNTKNSRKFSTKEEKWICLIFFIGNLDLLRWKWAKHLEALICRIDICGREKITVSPIPSKQGSETQLKRKRQRDSVQLRRRVGSRGIAKRHPDEQCDCWK